MAPSHKRLMIGIGIVLLAASSAGWFGGCRLFRRQGPMLDDVFRPKFHEVEFTDIEGDPAENIIRALVKLGVIEYNKGRFQPDKPISRGEFVAWLVRANNIFFRDDPGRWVKLASLDEPKVFMDVGPQAACFPYLQGLVNAGYVVAFDQRDYQYDHDLTREQLVLLRTGLTLGPEKVLANPVELDEYRVRLRMLLKDADLVTEEYIPIVLADLLECNTISLTFGKVDALCPQKLVTRREAVLALSELRGRTYKHAMKILPKWVPLPKSAQQELEKAAEEEHEH